uniref:Uncharacterized protein n=1 Tax=Rhizophora mucronata TaxID=61149 RepID=A0A2P2PXP9_RHIMU
MLEGFDCFMLFWISRRNLYVVHMFLLFS